MTLDQLLSLLMSATQGNQQAYIMARRMSVEFQSPVAPPDYQAMGRAMERILNGDRSADVLEGLPTELADAFGQVFGIVISAAPAGGLVKPNAYKKGGATRKQARSQSKKRTKKTALCPACGHENAAAALRCRACGKRFF